MTGAILSILLNPLAFIAAERLAGHALKPKADHGAPAPQLAATALSGHSILVGFGRVGGIVGRRLPERGAPLVVIEDDAQRIGELRSDGIECIEGNAARPDVLEAANIGGAKTLIVAIPNAFEAAAVVMEAKRRNGAVLVIARAHSEAEVENLQSHGADRVIMGEREIALGMLDYVGGDSDAQRQCRGRGCWTGGAASAKG